MKRPRFTWKEGDTTFISTTPRWLVPIKTWYIKHFTYTYEILTEIVRSGELIQEAIDRAAEGLTGHVSLVTKRRFPWQHPDTSQRKVVFIEPGEYTESISISTDYLALVGSAYKGSRILLPQGSNIVIEIIRGRFIQIKELFVSMSNRHHGGS